jgi:hypothetical protein
VQKYITMVNESFSKLNNCACAAAVARRRASAYMQAHV